MTFECLPNCCDCCGIIPVDKRIWEKHKEHGCRPIREIKELSSTELLLYTFDGLCYWLNGFKKCNIYDDRPILCRIFGQSQELKLQCPYLKPTGQKRSVAATKQFQRMYKKLGEKRPIVRLVRR